MNFSGDGRIVILDDRYDEAKPLMSFLGRQCCPYLYFTGHIPELPTETVKGVRFYFADIFLDGEDSADEKTIVSTQIGIFKRVFQERGNGPLVVVFWTKDSDLVDKILAEFRAYAKYPVFKMVIEKNDCFIHESGELVFKENRFESIIKEQIKSIDAILVYSSWEMTVHCAVSSLSNKLTTSWRSSVPPEMWQKGFESVLAILSHAAGVTDDCDDTKMRLFAAQTMYLEALNDEVLHTFHEHTAVDSVNLHIELPACLKSKVGPTDEEREIIADVNSFIGIGIQDLASLPLGEIKKFNYVDLNENKQSLWKSLLQKVFLKWDDSHLEEAADKISLCRVVITPGCDLAHPCKMIATDQGLLNRVIYGLIVPDGFALTLDERKREQFFCMGPVIICGERSYLCLSYHTLTTEIVAECDRSDVCIKAAVLHDLMVKVSNHVNRLGTPLIPIKKAAKTGV